MRYAESISADPGYDQVENEIEKYLQLPNSTDRAIKVLQYLWRCQPATNDNVRPDDYKDKKKLFETLSESLEDQGCWGKQMKEEFWKTQKENGWPWEERLDQPKGIAWAKEFMKVAIHLRLGAVRGKADYKIGDLGPWVQNKIYSDWTPTYVAYVEEAWKCASKDEAQWTLQSQSLG